ncbi:hypothetical protein CAI21_08735 [Alkalilimnicola ehrlichii]|uniref:DUF1801 domain-containing protein n=1 Tax=Alkalilimnicola ehrlichii TaxID=351052 RepID=UPI000E2E5F30|nr:DUF1801 domain-containing protein [Alkalilimnicola ehrlichii]RFA29904.1 hypothetical protein CAI21_08735 [Alkalilimnicola ehrlichii]
MSRIDRLLDDIRATDEARYELVQQLRAIVFELSPQATEEVKYGGLLFLQREPFCGVFAYAKHVSVELPEGHALVDRHQVLEGQGKYRRHIKLRDRDDISRKYVKDYVQQALEFCVNKNAS